MKTISKTLLLGVFLAVLTIAVPTFAQADVCKDIEANQDLYNGYTNNYKGTLDQKKQAVKAGEEYLQKYTSCEDYTAQINYLKKAVPKLKDSIVEAEAAEATKDRYNRFDKSLKSINGNQGDVAGVFSVSREILAKEPDFLDVKLAVATVGFDQAALDPPNNTYNDQTISYAKSAIEMLKADKPSTTKKYGVLGYEYENKDNALGWMNYIIGYITYYRNGTDDLVKDIGATTNQIKPLESDLKAVRDKLKTPEFKDDEPTKAREAQLKAQISGLKTRINGLKKSLQAQREKAMPYLYESIQVGTETKDNAFIYQTIGDYYFDEILRLADEVIAINDMNGGKESYESEYKFAIQKGYADRAVDAYARAYKLASAEAAKAGKDKATKQEYATVVYDTLKKVYSFRYGVDNAEGVDGFVATVSSKSMPNPMSDVKPVDPPDKPESTTDATDSTTSMNGSDAAKTNGKPKKQ